MHPDLVALLALQEDDGAIAQLEERLRELDARGLELDREQVAIGEALERARRGAEEEERRRRELAGKVQEHKTLQDRNLAALDAVRKPREAAAAMAQVDMTRKVLAQEESELHTLTGRIVELHQVVSSQEQALADAEERQRPAREELAAERASLEEEIAAARRKRAESASKVSRPLLAKYERIRGRANSNALYALRGSACGRCNTAIPLQRRNVMTAGRSIEVCEGCGVLLYASA